MDDEARRCGACNGGERSPSPTSEVASASDVNGDGFDDEIVGASAQLNRVVQVQRAVAEHMSERCSSGGSSERRSHR